MNKNRRSMLKALGSLGAFALIDCNGSTKLDPGSDGSAGATSDGGAGSGSSADLGSATTGDLGGGGTGTCVLDPSLTKGPYWVDTRIERSDLTSDTSGKASPNPRPGLPLALQLNIYAVANGQCSPLAGAQVDLWHCDGTGIYSDVAAGMGNPDTTGQTFLRGFQRTDANGVAQLKTIYPGWYSGRTVHIHVKVRLFDAASNTTTEATTQLFFDDSVTDAVYAANAPYSARGARDTRNAADNIYAGQTQLLVNLSGDTASGYTGTIALGIAVGTVFSG